MTGLSHEALRTILRQRDPSPARGRALSASQLATIVDPILHQIPITRVYEVGCLDYIGLPVWSAVTPLALDLTVHSGKGRSAEDARISAVMEAIERVCAEGRHLSSRTDTLAHLTRSGIRVIDPRRFDLPYETTFSPAGQCRWVRVTSLSDGLEYFVARDLVVSPASDGVCRGVETNGLGAGGALVDAVRHALYEVIERDAVSVEAFDGAHRSEGDCLTADPTVIDVATLPSPLRRIEQTIRKAGARLVVQLLHHPTAIPAFAAHLIDWSFPGMEGEPMTFEGSGADLDPNVAAAAAITEAVQAHSAVIAGARDTFEGLEAGLERRETLLRRGRLLFSNPNLKWSTLTRTVEAAGGDTVHEIAVLLRRLRLAGFGHVLFAELTRPDLSIPVVRVLVEGASQPYGDSSRRPPARLLRRLS